METRSAVGHPGGIGLCSEEGRVQRVWGEGRRDPMGAGEEPSFGFSERCVGNMGEADSLAGGGSDLRVSLEHGTQSGPRSGGIRFEAPGPCRGGIHWY
jgi:hypothetical protein